MKPCPYCQMPTTATAITACPTCRTPHHSECWSENTGCSVALCAAGPKLPYIAGADRPGSRRQRHAIAMDEPSSGEPLTGASRDAAPPPRRHIAVSPVDAGRSLARRRPAPSPVFFGARDRYRSPAPALVLAALVLLAGIGLAIAVGAGR